MLKIVVRFLISAAAVYLIARYVPGITVAGGTESILILAAVWSAIVMFVRPVLKVLTFPLTLLTLGLFSFVLNAILFFAMTYFVEGFHVAGIIPALIGSAILSFVTSLADRAID